MRQKTCKNKTHAPIRGVYLFYLVNRVVLLIVFGLFLQHAAGQKVIKKSLLNTNTSHIQIDTNNFFEVVVNTSSEHEIVLEAFIDGEYQKDLGLEIAEYGNTVMVSAAFQPHFSFPNDKLSAHKVISISLHVLIPEFKEVYLFGTSANITVEGYYKNLKVSLNDGRCIIKEVGENVVATTQSGAISLEIGSGKIIADSKYGTIDQEDIPDGNDQYALHSATGNISIKKSK